VLELERPPKDKEKLQREARRRVRHPLPVQLEVQQVVLEPEDRFAATVSERDGG